MTTATLPRVRLGMAVTTTATPAQVFDLPTVTDSTPEFITTYTPVVITDLQRDALRLYDAGFNILPIPRVGMEHDGKKPPYGRFGMLFASRIERASIPVLFERSNLAVLCGRLSHNLFVLDCDAEREFARVGRELDRRSIAAWAVTSGRGGHYWLLCADGEVKDKHLSDVLQVKGAGGYIVCPPSIHPTGAVYQWVSCAGALPPMVDIDALDFLKGIELRRRREGELPPTARQVLELRDIGRYASNSEAEYAAVLAMVKAGFTDADILSTFARYAPKHYASQRNPAAWLKRYMIDKARDKADASSAGNEADKRAAWAMSIPWPGRTGESDKAVSLALCHRAQLDGRATFRASVREVATLANVNSKTASAALRRLLAARLIERAGVDALSHSALYRFMALAGMGTLIPCNGSVPFTDNSDAWSVGALGKAGKSVYGALLRHGELKAGQLCDITGRSRQGVRRALERLELFGMAAVIGEVWYAEPVNKATLDAIAANCGTSGKAKRRLELFQAERARRVSGALLKQKRAWEAPHVQQLISVDIRC